MKKGAEEMNEFRNVISELKQIFKKDEKERLKEILKKEQLFKLYLFINTLLDTFRKEYIAYDQKRMDLVARISTEWTKWGIGMDFLESVIFPYLKIAVIHQFLNLSEQIDIQRTNYQVFILPQLKEDIILNSQKLKEYKVKFKVSLNGNEYDTDNPLDLAICSAKDILKDFYELDNSLFKNLESIRLEKKSPQYYFIHVPEADIGVHSLYAVIEGIVRNAVKHGERKGTLIVKLIFCETYEEVKKLFIPVENKDIEKKEDYYYLLITCSFDLIKNDLDKKLWNFFKQGIITETGEIQPENWGIKEIKISAGYFAGVGLEAVDTPNFDFLMVGRTRKEVWEDEKERLAYCIKLQKPRYLLIFSSNEDVKGRAKEFERYGIKVISEIKELKEKTWDYEILYVDKNKTEEFEKNIEEEDKMRLPQRVVYADETEDINWNQNPSKIILGIYDKWLEVWKRNKSLRSIKGMFYSETINVEKKTDYQDFKLYKKDMFTDFLTDMIKTQTRETKIVLAQHKTVSSIESLKSEVKKQILFYQQGTARDKFFSMFSNILAGHSGDNFGVNLLMRKFIESGLLKVLIIDERITQSVVNKMAPEEGPNIHFLDKLAWMGIFVASGVDFESGKESLDFVEKRGNTWDENLKKFLRVEIRKDGCIEVTGGEYKERTKDIDIFFIHQTKFNEIYNKLRMESKEELVKIWKEKIPYIIVHSGRGKPKGEKPKNTTFVGYSLLQNYVVNEPSKFYLVQMALGAKEEENG
ncbi:hypothetical protein J7L87_04310 [bacterium]|nr:hypothetical protein [bacterium]